MLVGANIYSPRFPSKLPDFYPPPNHQALLTGTMFQLIKVFFLILIVWGTFRLLELISKSRKWIKQAKTKGIGPFSILYSFPRSDSLEELVKWTNTPGNLNSAGFHHVWLGPVFAMLAASPEALKTVLTNKSEATKFFPSFAPSLVS